MANRCNHLFVDVSVDKEPGVIKGKLCERTVTHFRCQTCPYAYDVEGKWKEV